jgi:hypothetical protein
MDVDSLKVEELKAELKKRGCPAAEIRGKKAELAEMLRVMLVEETKVVSTAPPPVPAPAPALAPAPAPALDATFSNRKRKENDSSASSAPAETTHSEECNAPLKRSRQYEVEAKEQDAPTVVIKTEVKVIEAETKVGSSQSHAIPVLSARDLAAAQLDEEEVDYVPAQHKGSGERVKCPYLDTVNRHLLDFDMEKLCSVTLVNRNIYACLVCGKFLQGNKAYRVSCI